MKTMNLKTGLLGKILMASVVAGLLFTACDKEDEPGDVPSIALSSTSTANSIGSEVQTTLTVTAPEGLSSVIVLKNGAPFSTESISGNPKTVSWDFAYTVDAAIGSTVNFTFQAVDSRDRNSEIVLFSVLVTAKPIKDVSAGNLIGNHTWHADTIYKIYGFVRVGKDEPQDGGTYLQEYGTLTIEPGTLILGDKETKGTLVVQRGSKIIADGTKDAPIVMTSEQPIGLRLPGDWGGLVLCGRTVNNQGENVQLEGGYGAWHGGTKALDDVSESSGIIRYMRIEYAGIPINPNEEVNTLTMGSVGKGTVIEYVQASYGLDDAFEWFGGSVDCKYLIAYRGLDDDFDCDFGYSGYVQFGIGIRDNALADQSGSNGFEVDNNGSGSAAEPYTSGRFSNMTIIGPKKTRETAINTNFQHGAQLRRNSKLKIYNSFFTGYPWGIYIDDTKGNTSQHALSDELRIRNTIVAGVDAWGGNGYGSVYDTGNEGTVTGLPFGENKQHPNAPRGISLKQDATAGFNAVEWFETASYNNTRLASWTEAGINPTIFDLDPNPGFLPQAGSILLNYAKWENVPEAAQFEQVSFAGAFGTTNWTEDWTEFVPGIKVYF